MALTWSIAVADKTCTPHRQPAPFDYDQEGKVFGGCRCHSDARSEAWMFGNCADLQSGRYGSPSFDRMTQYSGPYGCGSVGQTLQTSFRVDASSQKDAQNNFPVCSEGLSFVPAFYPGAATSTFRPMPVRGIYPFIARHNMQVSHVEARDPVDIGRLDVNLPFLLRPAKPGNFGRINKLDSQWDRCHDHFSCNPWPDCDEVKVGRRSPRSLTPGSHRAVQLPDLLLCATNDADVTKFALVCAPYAWPSLQTGTIADSVIEYVFPPVLTSSIGRYSHRWTRAREGPESNYVFPLSNAGSCEVPSCRRPLIGKFWTSPVQDWWNVHLVNPKPVAEVAVGPVSVLSAKTNAAGACLMQMSATLSNVEASLDSSSSSIPEDWYIDLQRRVAQLESQCQAEYPEEVLFTVYTWFLDHATETKSSEAKLATLGGYPPDWESDILFPWQHRLIQGERVHINMVHPIMARLSVQEHIAHILITQRRSALVSTLLVVELQYPRPMIFRCALALPSQCTRQDVLQLSPIATEYADFLQWNHPQLDPHQQSFQARDGMGIHLLVDPEEISLSTQSEVREDTHSSPGNPTFQSGQSSSTPSGPVRGSEPPSIRDGPSGSTNINAVDLPNSNEEPMHYEFNIHAPVFVPGATTLESQAEFVQDLYHARNLLAFAWQEQVEQQTQAITWFVDHRFHFPICDEGRSVILDHRFHEWEQLIRDRWVDLIDPAQTLEMSLVMPAPPRLEPGVVAHVILVQSPRPEWEPSLVSVDDDVFTQVNSGALVRLVITTFEHFTIEQVVQVCGYPTTCTWAMQVLRCFA